MTTKQVQLLLAFLGYDPGALDGLLGTQTRNAVRQFQREYGLTVDGDPGTQTQKGLREAVADGRQKLPVSAPEAAGTSERDQTQTKRNWEGIEFFAREEFRCACGKYCNGYPVEPDPVLVQVCDEIRRRAGVPIGIVDDGGSGIRCPQHNSEVGGVANSEHLFGRAADLHPHGIPPQRLLAIAEEVTAERLPGKGGIGIYDWGCHVDVGKYSRWDERK